LSSQTIDEVEPTVEKLENTDVKTNGMEIDLSKSFAELNITHESEFSIIGSLSTIHFAEIPQIYTCRSQSLSNLNLLVMKEV
jgi:hypothetical protein